jgi:hypothetical protein
MAVTVTNSTVEPASFSIGTRKIQIVKLSANSGATSGTVTADNLRVLENLIAPSPMVFSAKTYSGNVATLTFTVPAETAATLTKGGVTYTAVANLGKLGNNITVAYTAGGTAGAEVVTVTGSAISVQIESGVSTITQVRTAVNASTAAAALVTATGTSGTAVSSATASALTGGVTGGVQSADCICVGY